MLDLIRLFATTQSPWIAALATIRRGHEVAGTELLVGEPTSSRKATVAALPFLPFVGDAP